ncbi:hypothetical protein LQ938_06380 [Microbacterium sp. cx-55]|uniref:hypothetical protein n=1 Tax=unclassified Microbacterium TaxID=2609290 RepID=UPI001CBE9217|nr:MULTISPECIES: hypothetical protein [unclassified Microbacterium]MCC4907597.1 hypothetical protein [Microbacterium sp. cx-59]UGB36404.1 hypothetical protein LQ938_06380 [Microbacterium sp. cx-55]
MTDDHTPANSVTEFDPDAPEHDASHDVSAPRDDAALQDGAVPETSATETAEPPQYGVGPFSIREVVLAGIWALGFLFSFFSIFSPGFESVWTSGLTWVLTIGTPTVAVFLIVLRRLSPGGIRRVGSLGIDQFASVAFSVSAVLWLQMVWASVTSLADNGVTPYSWVVWVELVLMTAGVVFTVFAPFVPGIGEDFRYRAEIVAHRNARPLRPVTVRPAAPRPVRQPAPSPAPAPAPEYATGAYPAADNATGAQPAFAATQENATAVYDTGEFRPFGDAFVETGAQQTIDPDPEPVAEPAAQQPFWALAPVEREVLDERGAPLFVIGPTAWALVIEDRGEVFVVRHEDGRIGYLHDVTDVTRG